MLSLLIILPVLLLALSALGILIQQQTKRSIGYSWLIASVTSTLTVGVILGLRWRLPSEVVLSQWRPFGELSSPPAFLLDYVTWPFALCLAVLLLSSILTDSARLQSDARPFNWITGMSMTAVGLLAIMAGNLQTLVVSWTAVDLIELVLVLTTQGGRRMGQQTVTVFSVRFGGTLLVIMAILFAYSQGFSTNISTLPESLAIFMLLAVGLRLGVLPLNLPYTREVYPTRGLGNTLRMIAPASSLMVLGHLTIPAQPAPWQPLLLGLSAFAAIYGSAMWMTADNELNGRPYWSIALAALAIASVLNGKPSASVAWGAALLLVGSLMFLFTAHRRGNPTIPFVGLIGLTGLPYSPLAAGWEGIAGERFRFSTIVFILSAIFLIWGYLRHTFHPRDELHRMERWVHAVYPAGLFGLIIAHWLIGLFGWPGSLTVGTWWAPVAVVVLSAAGAGLFYANRGIIQAGSGTWLAFAFRRVGNTLGAFFRLNWLYRLLVWVYGGIQGVILLLTAIFEGDGGFLWSMVLLALLLSLVVAGAQP